MMLAPFTPSPRLTLIGVGGETLVLSDPGESRAEGYFLTELPDLLTLVEFEHQHTRAVGLLGGLWESATTGVGARSLHILVRGADIRGQLRTLINALGGGDIFRLVYREHTTGFHWLVCRVKGISTKLHGAMDNPVMAEVDVQLVLDRPVWNKFSTLGVFGREEVAKRTVTFETESTVPFWPVIEATGGYESLQVRVGAGDEWLKMSGDVKFVSDPATRAFLTPDGAPLAKPPVMPFWERPITPRNGVCTLHTIVSKPHDDFQLKISAKTEVHTVWQ